MNITVRKSKKLFYKKYLYKVEISFVLGNIFRTYWQRTNQLDYAHSKIQEYRHQLQRQKHIEEGYYKKIRFSHNEVDDAEQIRLCLNQIKDYMIRQEYTDRFAIYVNQCQDLINTLQNLKTVGKITVTEPDPSIANIKDPDMLVSKKADQFAYKVTLNAGSLRRTNPTLLNWIAANRDKIKITDYGLEKAYSTVGVYVRDDKVLMLLQMTGDKYIKRIEKLVLPD
jgi:hypothetical protein